jgi:hypothetical protein
MRISSFKLTYVRMLCFTWEPIWEMMQNQTLKLMYNFHYLFKRQNGCSCLLFKEKLHFLIITILNKGRDIRFLLVWNALHRDEKLFNMHGYVGIKIHTWNPAFYGSVPLGDRPCKIKRFSHCVLDDNIPLP